MRFRLSLLLALACATPAIAGDSIYTKTLESVLTLRIDGDIEIDGQGQVVSHKLDTELPAPSRHWSTTPSPAGNSRRRSKTASRSNARAARCASRWWPMKSNRTARPAWS